MIVENKTPYPDAEVRRVVERGFTAGRGKQPRKVIVRYRTLPTDTRMGWTPDDHRLPTELYVEPADRYPQYGPTGARSWKDELLTSALHESEHYRHGSCQGPSCERSAEAYAQQWRRRLHGAYRRKSTLWGRTADRAARRRGER